MGNIKNFELFKESYSDDLAEILDNEENIYIIFKGDDIIVGFEFIDDCFTHISELLESDGAITEEQRYEFDDYVSEYNVEDLVDQYEIDEFMSELLDKFEVVEPYKIVRRDELEDSPSDLDMDDGLDMDMSDYLGTDLDIDDDLDMLGESVSNDPFYIVGDLNGKEVIIDGFDSDEEANEFINDYKTIYNEYDNIRISPNTLTENVDNEEEDETKEWTNEKTSKCNCYNNGKCTCGDKCICGSECTCKECGKSNSNKSKIKKFDDFNK